MQFFHYNYLAKFRNIPGIVYIIPGQKYPKLVIDENEYAVYLKHDDKTRWRCNDVIYMLPGGRKHPRIAVDGFEYIVHRKGPNKTRWRCMYEFKKCTSFIYTYGNNVIVKNAHNHSCGNTAKIINTGIPKQVTIIRCVDPQKLQ
ncbi:unnamed protein product [Phyllotreta striolata]|uniref:FLYWCH-type domain-containing protein n=1 Tax=Phyllotreta striolata TaxID=444603 RepID=A0A9N9XLH0_PHYSR|nr:unnamed protein product [Phyllotreta striolata]